MTDFKAKMHQIRFRLGLRPRPRWRSLQRPSRPLSWIWGSLRGRERGWAGEEEGKGEGRGGKGKAPKLLLNQGPSEPCYATGCIMHSVFNGKQPGVSIRHRSDSECQQTASSLTIMVIDRLRATTTSHQVRRARLFSRWSLSMEQTA